ncbi:flagellar basal-body rod protein FlgF [Desulfogranum japonicum]|uniref:flagellar basal-body rod protein FlgF n=1 Tax=Desulfogranum japonicum TaxID=231447 RepID=UPI0004014C0B|nr:flagellar basal-body rod protein FlgF [Desulfogranum japonicum]
MVSGKYGALSGAVSREQAMSNIAANLANVNTTGFKKNRISFQAILRGEQQNTNAKGINYARIRAIETDFSQGAMQQTDRPLDVAIDGEGFFKIRKGNDIMYTRAGHFMIDEDGMIKTSDGYNVISQANQPLQLLEGGGSDIIINEAGGISVDGVDTGVGLQIFTVADPQQLKQVGNSRFQLEQGGGDLPAADSRIIQGSLETSNVNMMEEMAHMISIQRKFEAHLKVLDRYSTLGERQDELGSVG